MGADLIIACIPYCALTEERLDFIKHEILDKVNSPDDLSEYFCEELENRGYSMISSEDKEMALRELNDVKDKIMSLLNDIYDGRDTVVITIPDTVSIAVTGGMSWGETPTDSFDDFTMIAEWPKLYDQLLKWSKEDIKK